MYIHYVCISPGYILIPHSNRYYELEVYLITILPKNQAASIEMVISDFFRIPKTFIAFVSLCHKSPKAKGKLLFS